jgi:acyl-CoA thioester hydrolase
MKHPTVLRKSMANSFSSQYRIYYEDTDSGGIVYYANYLKIFERARTDMFRERELSQKILADEQNLAFVVASCNVEYKKAAKLDDLVTVKTIVENIGSSTILFHQEMFLGDKLLNVLNSKIACIDTKTQRPARIPTQIKNKIDV